MGESWGKIVKKEIKRGEMEKKLQKLGEERDKNGKMLQSVVKGVSQFCRDRSECSD